MVIYVEQIEDQKYVPVVVPSQGCSLVDVAEYTV